MIRAHDTIFIGVWGLGSSVGRATFMKDGGQGFKPFPMPFP